MENYSIPQDFERPCGEGFIYNNGKEDICRVMPVNGYWRLKFQDGSNLGPSFNTGNEARIAALYILLRGSYLLETDFGRRIHIRIMSLETCIL